VTLLAAGASTSAWNQPGTLGFLVIFGMSVILYFVFRSMSRHLKKVKAAAAAEATLQAASGADATVHQDVKQDQRDGPAIRPGANNGSRSAN
jgi:hypothetical protein